ncbi:MAG TPA: hypothetical protein VEA99_17535, partial [Gemmatimonadaceae bacterium]|nr:hypothetical protein [Gemmatimonadaceae bacterium]
MNDSLPLDPPTGPAPAAPSTSGERRTRTDRRGGPADAGRRRRRTPRWLRDAKRVGFFGFAIALLVSTILVAVQNTRPIFARKATLTERIAQRADSLQRARGATGDTLVAGSG